MNIIFGLAFLAFIGWFFTALVGMWGRISSRVAWIIAAFLLSALFIYSGSADGDWGAAAGVVGIAAIFGGAIVLAIGIGFRVGDGINGVIDHVKRPSQQVQPHVHSGWQAGQVRQEQYSPEGELRGVTDTRWATTGQTQQTLPPPPRR